MKNTNKLFLHAAIAEFIQLHAFDHLMDFELANFKNVINQWVSEENDSLSRAKLIDYLGKINLFVDHINPASIQLWYHALSYNNIELTQFFSELQDVNSYELI
jgi:hypothetical protein